MEVIPGHAPRERGEGEKKDRSDDGADANDPEDSHTHALNSTTVIAISRVTAI